MWECVNRRGITPLGNIITDGIEKIWDSKPRGRTDFTGCRILCRNNELNKTLWEVFGPEPKNVEFV
jgi:hypothetical protein